MAAIAKTSGADTGRVVEATERACDRLLGFLDGCYRPAVTV